MKNLTFLILVVVYKENVLKSQTVISILEQIDSIPNDSKVVLWDNSPISAQNEDLDALKQMLGEIKFEYVFDPKNSTMSKLFNYIIENKFHEDYLILFDQDSLLSKTYFKKLFDIIKKDDLIIKLILPRVYYQNKLVSPAKRYLFWGQYFKHKLDTILPTKNVTAINSGMTIYKDLFYKDGFRYDEDFKFYCTDDDFMHFYQSKYDSVCVFDGFINHKLDFFENPDIEVKIRKYIEMKNANKIYINKYYKEYLVLFYVFYFIVSFYYAFRFKSIKFLSC